MAHRTSGLISALSIFVVVVSEISRLAIGGRHALAVSRRHVLAVSRGHVGHAIRVWGIACAC